MEEVSEGASSLLPSETKGSGGAAASTRSIPRSVAPASQRGMGQTGRHRLF